MLKWLGFLVVAWISITYTGAWAQTWPAKTVRIVVTLSAEPMTMTPAAIDAY